MYTVTFDENVRVYGSWIRSQECDRWDLCFAIIRNRAHHMLVCLLSPNVKC